MFYLWAFGEFRDAEPVIIDDFYLDRTDASREYFIRPRVKDSLAGANGDYELSVYLDKVPSGIKETLEFHPLVKVSTILNGKLLESTIVDKKLSVYIDKRYSKKVVITKLPSAIWRIKNAEYTIKVEVLRGDSTMSPYKDHFSTRIAVDSYP